MFLRTLPVDRRSDWTTELGYPKVCLIFLLIYRMGTVCLDVCLVLIQVLLFVAEVPNE